MKQGLALILAAAFLLMPCAAAADNNMIGRDVSAFSASSVITNKTVDGSVFENYDITILYYFAAWSPNAVSELQYMLKAYTEYAGSLNVLGLLYEDSESTPAHVSELKNHYGFGFDFIRIDSVLNGIVSRCNYIPQTFIISREGTVLEHFPGVLPNYETLDGMISRRVNGANPPYLKGDADGNGEVNAADAVLVLRCAMGIYENRIIPLCCDLSENGKIGADDAVFILRIALGIAI